MTEQDLFEFLQANLSIDVSTESDYYGGNTIHVKLFLTNPKTGKAEQISSGSDSIS